MNEVEKDVKIFLKIKKTSHVNVFEKLLLWKCSFSKFGIVPIKITNDILYRTIKNSHEIHMEAERPQIAKEILNKKNKAGT
jgi:hypothetical protein